MFSVALHVLCESRAIQSYISRLTYKQIPEQLIHNHTKIDEMHTLEIHIFFPICMLSFLVKSYTKLLGINQLILPWRLHMSKLWYKFKILQQGGVGRISLPITKQSSPLGNASPGMNFLQVFISFTWTLFAFTSECYNLVQRAPRQHWAKSSKQTLTCITLANHSTLSWHTSFLTNQLLPHHFVAFMR